MSMSTGHESDSSDELKMIPPEFAILSHLLHNAHPLHSGRLFSTRSLRWILLLLRKMTPRRPPTTGTRAPVPPLKRWKIHKVAGHNPQAQILFVRTIFFTLLVSLLCANAYRIYKNPDLRPLRSLSRHQLRIPPTTRIQPLLLTVY